jgi:maleate isomerase
METASALSQAMGPADHGRRDFLRYTLAACAALAAAPSMMGTAFAQTSSWRGVVGCIKPTLRPGTLEELIRMLPVGIGVLPVYLEFHEGTTQEFRKGVDQYEHYVEFLAKHNCDIIHPEGAPVFMVLGREGETKLTQSWEKKYGKPIFTAPQNQVNALHALGAKSLYGATYFPDPKQNQIYAKYFQDAGFKVFGMEGLKGIDFAKVQDVSAEQIYAFIKKGFLANPGGDAIYMLGSAWRTLEIIEPLEQDLGVPVVHAEVARAWEIQKRLHVNQPFKGYGRLLATLPPLKV